MPGISGLQGERRLQASACVPAGAATGRPCSLPPMAHAEKGPMICMFSNYLCRSCGIIISIRTRKSLNRRAAAKVKAKAKAKVKYMAPYNALFRGVTC